MSRLTSLSIAGCLATLGLGVAVTATCAQERVKFVGEYKLIRGTDQGRLILRAKIVDGHHIYAVTQKGSPPPTKIEIKDSKQFRLDGTFRPDKKPVVVEHDPLFDNRVEKHYGSIEFSVPIQIAQGVDATRLNVHMKFHGQVCSNRGACYPLFNKQIPVRFGGYVEKTEKSGAVK